MNESGIRVNRFWENVPKSFVHDLLHALFACYAVADEDCGKRFGEEEKRNVKPFYRRGLVEAEMRSIASRFDGVSAEPVLDEGGFWWHSRLIFGRIILTQSAAGRPDQELRPSRYKTKYASAKNQLYLFDVEDSEVDALTYAVLTHGQSKISPFLPEFAVIRFPKPNLDGFYRGVIDLFEEFPDVVQANASDRSSDEIKIHEPRGPILLDEGSGIGTAG